MLFCDLDDDTPDIVPSFPRLWITATRGQQRIFVRVPLKWSHSLIWRVTTSTLRPPSLASPATARISLCWSSVQILALVSVDWVVTFHHRSDKMHRRLSVCPLSGQFTLQIRRVESGSVTGSQAGNRHLQGRSDGEPMFVYTYRRLASWDFANMCYLSLCNSHFTLTSCPILPLLGYLK